MARHPNTRPTNIYWLLDIRPETIAAGHALGRPFYCGKTVQKPEYRFNTHLATARHYPKRLLSVRLIEYGGVAGIVTMEVVPVGADWAERERQWIRILRHAFPGCVNVSDGGDGCPGHIPTAAHRAKMSARMKGRTFSPETRAKMSARMKGNPIRKGKTASPEVRAAMSAARRGKKLKPHTPEARAKISAAQKGRPVSDERRAKLRAAWKHRLPASAETNAKISAAHKGRVFSDDHRAKLRDAWTLRKAAIVVDNLPACV